MGENWAARERYLIAIEIDQEFVEARSSLGGLLAEMGRNELAVAAFRGALAIHDDYPDVHYNLARTLDDLQREVEADHHWRRFLELSPESQLGPPRHENDCEIRRAMDSDARASLKQCRLENGWTVCLTSKRTAVGTNAFGLRL
ncbi:MAG: hypothetical protein R3C05_29040 [Pirellulaceae bacterium]